ncbi:MAG: capsular polysaccharide biosynthesis protein [Lachnospiraceae bacterium]|nr:capsular polysaccharide biosynthesis protein [Lachnospiraceae bacterium]
MIDFHAHILPGIDDGSRDREETGQLLEAEAEQGVEAVVATPHFYAHHTTPGRFLEKRELSFQRLQEVRTRMKDEGGAPPEVLKAAEVFYFPGIGQAERLKDLTLEGTDLLLLEMPFCQWDAGVLEDVREIMDRQRLRVILVHLERFYPIQKKKDIWEEVLNLPVIIQLNTGSFLEWRGKRVCRKLMQSGLPVLLGTDCHNMKNRKPDMAEGRRALAKMLGEAAAERTEKLAGELLAGRLQTGT